MLHKPLFKELTFFFIIVGVINHLANTNDWYWSIRELDSLVHFLGGVTTALFFLWLYFFSGFFAPKKRELFQFFYISFVGIVFVAVIWEIYELLLGEAEFNRAEYPFDTTLDFIMDFLGAFAACLYGFLKELVSRKSLVKNDFDTTHV